MTTNHVIGTADRQNLLDKEDRHSFSQGLDLPHLDMNNVPSTFEDEDNISLDGYLDNQNNKSEGDHEVPNRDQITPLSISDESVVSNFAYDLETLEENLEADVNLFEKKSNHSPVISPDDNAPDHKDNNDDFKNFIRIRPHRCPSKYANLAVDIGLLTPSASPVQSDNEETLEDRATSSQSVQSLEYMSSLVLSLEESTSSVRSPAGFDTETSEVMQRKNPNDKAPLRLESDMDKAEEIFEETLVPLQSESDSDEEVETLQEIRKRNEERMIAFIKSLGNPEIEMQFLGLKRKSCDAGSSQRSKRRRKDGDLSVSYTIKVPLERRQSNRLQKKEPPYKETDLDIVLEKNQYRRKSSLNRSSSCNTNEYLTELRALIDDPEALIGFSDGGRRAHFAGNKAEQTHCSLCAITSSSYNTNECFTEVRALAYDPEALIGFSDGGRRAHFSGKNAEQMRCTLCAITDCDNSENLLGFPQGGRVAVMGGRKYEPLLML